MLSASVALSSPKPGKRARRVAAHSDRDAGGSSAIQRRLHVCRGS